MRASKCNSQTPKSNVAGVVAAPMWKPSQRGSPASSHEVEELTNVSERFNNHRKSHRHSRVSKGFRMYQMVPLSLSYNASNAPPSPRPQQVSPETGARQLIACCIVPSQQASSSASVMRYTPSQCCEFAMFLT